MDQQTTINISTASILKFISIILGLIFLYFLRDIVLMIFAALILAIAFDRPIDALEKRGVPRFLGVILIYLLLFAVIAFLFYLIFPVLAAQIKNFVTNYSFYLKKVGQLQPKTNLFNLKDLFNQLADRLTASAETVFGTLVAFFGGVISFLTVLVVTIFLNVQEKGVRKFVFYLTSEKHQDYALHLFDRIQQKVGGWLWGKIILAIIIGALVSGGLFLLGIQYALLLGFLAALLNFIPVIGAIISAVPAVLLGLTQSPILGLAVVLLYLFINIILENFFLVPLLMKKAVDLNPALIILVLLLGSKIAGVIGVILAIPAAAIISVLLDEYIQHKSKGKEAEII